MMSREEISKEVIKIADEIGEGVSKVSFTFLRGKVTAYLNVLNGGKKEEDK